MGKQRTGDEHIRFDGMPIGHLLGDYWAWNSSDLLINTERGSFSEFIVSAALDLDLSGTRVDWGPYDVSFPFEWCCGDELRKEVRIEVKSSAYLQSWDQDHPSSIVFSIRPARAWDPKLGYYGELLVSAVFTVVAQLTIGNTKREKRGGTTYDRVL